MYELQLSTVQRITFVMVDISANEVSGLGGALSIEVSKNGGAFAPAAGAQAEISNGWYSYVLTAGETDTVGPLSVRVNGAGAVQQNLEYIVESRAPNAIEFTYTVTDSVTMNPIPGVTVWITATTAEQPSLWVGQTDALGVARDDEGDLPRLDTGTWYFWSHKVGYNFTNPDAEVVSP